MYEEDKRTPEEIERDRATVRAGVNTYFRNRYGSDLIAEPKQGGEGREGDQSGGPDVARTFIDRKYAGPAARK